MLCCMSANKQAKILFNEGPVSIQMGGCVQFTDYSTYLIIGQ